MQNEVHLLRRSLVCIIYVKVFVQSQNLSGRVKKWVRVTTAAFEGKLGLDVEGT